MALQVSPGVKNDECADEADQQRKQQAEPIHIKRERNPKGRDPFGGEDKGLARRDGPKELGKIESQTRREHRENPTRRVTDPTPHKRRKNSQNKGCERCGKHRLLSTPIFRNDAFTKPDALVHTASAVPICTRNVQTTTRPNL